MLPGADGRRVTRVEVRTGAAAERQVVAAVHVVDPDHRPDRAIPRAHDGDVLLRSLLAYPRLEREGGVVERAQSGKVDPAGRSVERGAIGEASGDPRRPDRRAVEVVVRRVDRDSAAGRIQGVRDFQAGGRHAAVVHRDVHRRRGTGVPARVTRYRSQRVSSVPVSASVPLDRIRSGRVLGPDVGTVDSELHSRNGDVVGRVRAERHGRLKRRAGSRGRDRHLRPGRVCNNSGARLVGGRADVAGLVFGRDLVEVGSGSEPGVGVAGGGHLGHAVGRTGCETGGRVAMDVVPRHSDVVRGRSPAQRRHAHAAGRGQRPGRGRWRQVGRRNRLAHVGCDLAGRESAVVDADVVDDTVEEATRARAIGADAPDVRVADAARDVTECDLGAVDVVTGRGAVERGREVLPFAGDRALLRSRGSRRGWCRG